MAVGLLAVVWSDAAAWSQSKSGQSESGSSTRSVLVSKVTAAIVERTNAFRVEEGMDRLDRSQALDRAAAKFAEYMASNDIYGHQADGRTPAQRAKAAGYEYCVVRENIAYRTNTGEVTVDSLTEVFVQGWIDSSSHRDNLLASYVTETGAGVATSDGVTFFAVQLFGRPKSLQIQVKIQNQSSNTRTLVLESGGNVDQFEMPPRVVATLTRCVPTEVRLEDGEERFLLSESAELTITAEGLQR